ISAIPAVRTNVGVLPPASPVREPLEQIVMPMMLVLLLLELDVVAAMRVMGRGVGVMLFGTAGVVLGAPLGLLLVRPWLEPNAWQAFGSLAGSWVGGTANMAAVAQAIDAGDAQRGLAVLGDTSIYLIWLPVLMASKALAVPFARWARVPVDRVASMEAAAAAIPQHNRVPTFPDYLSLLAVGLAATWVAGAAAEHLGALTPYLSTGAWRVLLVTTLGIALSLTPLRRIPGSRELGTALVMLFMAHMGSTADVPGIARQAVPFLLGALAWIFIHGAFCLLGARLLHVDVHTAAIASAANIGGVATASQVAAYHKQSLPSGHPHGDARLRLRHLRRLPRRPTLPTCDGG
ncbi:MAG TPA: DUF819 family protein, partial [Lacipirellulaceae bacterium]|nr:DUF819 family protein [Lacipirellulaceae bacterium]